MSLQALFGEQVSRIEDAQDVEQLKRVLIDILSSAAPIRLGTPLKLDNRTNSAAIQVVNNGRDDSVGLSISDKSGRQTTLGIGLGNTGLVANEIIPDRNFVLDPATVQAKYAGQNVGSGYGAQASGTGIFGKLKNMLVKPGWGRLLDSYIKSLKTWHPPNTADQFSLNGNNKWWPSDPCGWAIVHCTVLAVNADTLTCQVINDSSGSDPAGIIGSTITVCKPWWLMRTPFDGQTIDGITYTYSDNQHRNANNGTTTENQIVHPYYKSSDVYGTPSKIYARWSCNGTDKASVWYIDVNTDARTWAAT